MRAIKRNSEIEWLYDHSATEMGYSAIDYETLSSGNATGATAGLLFQLDPVARSCIPGWLSPPGPTVKQQNAARRQRWYLEALREIEPRHQAAIDCAYQIRDLNGLPDVAGVPGGPDLVRDYGIAAPVVRRVLLERRAVEYLAECRIGDAGRKLARVRRDGTQLGVAAAQAAVTAAKQELREEEATTKRAARRAATLLDAALRAYEGVRRQHRDEARAELDEARERGRSRREAMLAELLELPKKERLAAAARAWMAEIENRVAAQLEVAS